MGDDVNYLNTKGSYSHSSSGLQEGDTGSYWEGRTLHRALCCTAVTGTTLAPSLEKPKCGGTLTIYPHITHEGTAAQGEWMNVQDPWPDSGDLGWPSQVPWPHC